MNRSTIFEYLKKDSGLELVYTKIGKGNYPVLRVPFKWETGYLLINGSRFENIQSVILFSSELVVRFMMYGDCQVNVPYKDIEYIEVLNDDNFETGYQGLHQGKKLYHQE